MNAAERAALRNEILTGPLASSLAAAVAAGNHASADGSGVADILNRRDQPASKAVPAWQAKKLLIKRGKWRGIVLASSNAQHPVVEAAYAAVALAEDARMDADFKDAAAGPLLDALVQSGLMDAADRAALEALSSDLTSRAEIVLGRQVHHLEVAEALR